MTLGCGPADIIGSARKPTARLGLDGTVGLVVGVGVNGIDIAARCDTESMQSVS